MRRIPSHADRIRTDARRVEFEGFSCDHSKRPSLAGSLPQGTPQFCMLTARELIRSSIRRGALVHENVSALGCCATNAHHEPRGLWHELLPALHIDARRGIFVDVGTSADMADGGIALQHNFSVIAVEARRHSLLKMRNRFRDAIKDGRLTTINAAITDAAGSTVAVHEGGDASSIKEEAVAHAPPALVNKKMVNVRTLTLASLVGSRPCAVIKLDIQGVELEALIGALPLLRRPVGSAPLVVFELYEKLRSSDLRQLEILHLMRALGYRCLDTVSAGGGGGGDHGGHRRRRWGASSRDGKRTSELLVPHSMCVDDYAGLLWRRGFYVGAWLQRTGIVPNGWLYGRSFGWPYRGSDCGRPLETDFVCIRVRNEGD